ncbi:glycosyltransferase family 2 protein [Patescibacteria group bacterium]|nr:glycosyltransferase family 2 protein [Patescibacteria group bacterium]
MPQLSVVIPVFNEEKTLAQLISQINNLPLKNIEVIVVDDGSTDSSRKIAAQLLAKNKISRLYLRKKNLGKGAALKVGFKLATGDMVVIQDADLEYDPVDYERMIKPIAEGRADVVYGSRFLGSRPHRVLYFWHYIANQLLTLWCNIFTNLNLSDMETGFKVFKREVLKDIDITERSFGIEPELTVKIAKKNVRIYEVGISYHGRTYDEGKKIGLKDFFRALYVVAKWSLIG